MLQLLYIIAHEIIVSDSVSEYTHGPWKVNGASRENEFQHMTLHHCSYIGLLYLQHILYSYNSKVMEKQNNR